MKVSPGTVYIPPGTGSRQSGPPGRTDADDGGGGGADAGLQPRADALRPGAAGTALRGREASRLAAPLDLRTAPAPGGVAPQRGGPAALRFDPADEWERMVVHCDKALEGARLLAQRGGALGVASDASLKRWDEALASLDGAILTLASVAGADASRAATVASAKQQATEVRALLQKQRDHLQTCIDSSPFSRRRQLETRASYWHVAADMLEAACPQGDRPERVTRRIDEFRARARTLLVLAGSARGALDPASILAGRSFSRLDRWLGRDRDALRDALEGPVLQDQRQALSEVRTALANARKDGAAVQVPSEKHAKAQFMRWYGQYLNRREAGAVERTVLLPVKGQAQHTTVTCRQTAGAQLSDELHAAYARDGLQRANCHSAAEHRHALTLNHVEMHAQDGRRLMSAVRHGVLSAHAYTGAGIRKLFDEQLGRAALDLSEGLGDHNLRNMKQRAPADVTRNAAHEAGAYVRSKHTWFARLLGSTLLERLRAAANVSRAKEVVQAVACSLPESELSRIHAQSNTGGVPTLRIASMSLLTPDALRWKQTDNERRMWADQCAAWKALAGKEITVPVPRLDARGQVVRDRQNRIATEKIKVKLEIAAFNFPVNEFATKFYSRLDIASGIEFTRPANDEAMRSLLGADFRKASADAHWQPGGWVGMALREKFGDDPKTSRLLRTLSGHVARLYASGGYVGTGKNPYAMATCVSALVELTQVAGLAVNCKSAKDRTSVLLALLEQTLLEMDTTGVVPDPHALPDEVGRTQARYLHDAGGHREVQWQNTNQAGTKIKHPHVFERLGFGKKDHASVAGFQGMSHLVSS